MNAEKRTETSSYFAAQRAEFEHMARMLAADDRGDEAVFAKIRMNVCDIFASVFSAALKTAGQEDDKAVQFFLERMGQIPQNWRDALERAEAHGESEKAHIERIKLETAGQIQKKFKKIWEVDP